MINNTKNGATKEEVRQHLQSVGDAMPMKDKITGSSGGLGLVAGAGSRGGPAWAAELLRRRGVGAAGGRAA